MDGKKPRLSIVDDPASKEIYANTVIGTAFDGGALSITLGVGRFMPKKTDEAPTTDTQPVVHVTARIALSPSAAMQLANALKGMLEKLSETTTERLRERMMAGAVGKKPAS